MREQPFCFIGKVMTNNVHFFQSPKNKSQPEKSVASMNVTEQLTKLPKEK